MATVLMRLRVLTRFADGHVTLLSGLAVTYYARPTLAATWKNVLRWGSGLL